MQVAAGDPADLSQVRRDDPGPRVLFVPGAGAAQEVAGPSGGEGLALEWADIVHDLDALHETTVTLEDRGYVVRSQAKRTVGKVFQACGVALPPALRSLPAAESPPPG